MKKKTLTIPLWDRDVYILIGGKEKDVLRFVKTLDLSKQLTKDIEADTIDTGTKAAAWFCMKFGEGVMWFPKKKVKHSLRAHEVTHIVDYMLKFIGASDEMEARAYSVEWLMEKLEKILK